MSDDDRRKQIYDDIYSRAVAVEPNAVVPGEPTLIGWLNTLIEEVVDLRVRVDAGAPGA